MPTRILLRLSLLAGLVAPLCAFALGVGPLEVRSALNQNFEAEIPLISNNPAELLGLSVQIPRQQVFDQFKVGRPYFLSKLRFSVQTPPGGPNVIKIRSVEPIREPNFGLLVELVWPRGRLLREFPVHLDPDLYANRRQPPPPQPAALPPPIGAQPATASEPVAARLPPAPPVSFEGASSYGPVKPGETLMGIASQARPSTAISLPKMMAILVAGNPQAFVNGNPNTLRTGAVLKVPTPQALGAQGASTPPVTPNLAMAPAPSVGPATVEPPTSAPPPPPPVESRAQPIPPPVAALPPVAPPPPVAALPPVAPPPPVTALPPVAPPPPVTALPPVAPSPPVTTALPPVAPPPPVTALPPVAPPTPLPTPAETLREIVPQASIPQAETPAPPATSTATTAPPAAQPPAPTATAPKTPAPTATAPKTAPAAKPPAQPEETGFSWLDNPVVWIAISLIVLAVAAMILLPLLRRPARPKPLVEKQEFAIEPSPEASDATLAAPVTRSQAHDSRDTRPILAATPQAPRRGAEPTPPPKPVAAPPPKPISELLKDIDFGLGGEPPRPAVDAKGSTPARHPEAQRLLDTEPPTASVTRAPLSTVAAPPAKSEPAKAPPQPELPSDLRLDNLNFDFSDLGLENTARPQPSELPPLEMKPSSPNPKPEPVSLLPNLDFDLPEIAAKSPSPTGSPAAPRPLSQKFEFTDVTQELAKNDARVEPLRLEELPEDPNSQTMDLGKMEASARGRGGQEATTEFVETKLDLATAYLDMGDQVGARSLLEEVLQEGDASQKKRAGELFKKLT